jgi:AraC-like DNA-binding protein
VLAGAGLASGMFLFSSAGDTRDVIARDVGFADAMRMRDAFIRIFGFFPREMRRNARLTNLKVVDRHQSKRVNVRKLMISIFYA